MSSDELTVWTKIERSAAAAPPVVVPPAYQPDEGASGEEAKRRFAPRTVIRALDTVSTVFWAYVLTKVFVVDVDGRVARGISPRLVGALDYRIFFYLAVIAVVLVWFRKWSWVLAYVALFPLIVLVWKLPAFFIRRRSWGLFLGAVQATVTAFSAFRYNFLTKSAALLCLVLILATGAKFILVIAGVYIAGLLAWSYGRLLRRTFSAPSFLTRQRDNIWNLVNSRPVRFVTSLAADARSSDVELYDRAQLSQITTAISVEIMVNKLLYYWAYQLERYRRHYSPALIFNAVAYVWLFLGTLVSFSLINEAMIKAFRDQYQFSSGHMPSFLAVCVYSMATLFVSTGGGISAVGNAAYVLQLSAGVIGPLFLVACGLNFLVTFRRERDEGALRDLVMELKARAREQDARFRSEWYVSVDEARRRLDSLGEGLSLIFRYFIQAVPEDFLRDEPEKPPA